MIDFSHIGNVLIDELHIAKNIHGVFFSMDDKRVLRIDDLSKRIRNKYPKVCQSEIREVICYIDDVCKKCSLSSEYYRKSVMMYGLYTKAVK